MRFVRRQDAEPAINLTPLIDVVFILLIFFMVSTRFADESELALELPAAGAAQPADTTVPLSITVSRDGRYGVDGQAVAPQRLIAVLRSMRAQYPRSALRVRADGNARHKDVVRVMDAASAAGFARVDIATRSP